MASDLMIDAEKRVCINLSDLFLDTQLTVPNLDGMALSLQQLNLPIATLDHAIRNDLFPTLYPNLMSVGGAWSGFNENWLFNQLESQRLASPGWVQSPGVPVSWLAVGSGG